MTAVVTYEVEVKEVDDLTTTRWKELFQDMPIGLAIEGDIFLREVSSSKEKLTNNL